MKLFSDVTIRELHARGVSFERIGPPSIQANHIDGPLLHFSDGQLHWLGLWERLLFWLGRTDAERLQKKLRPRLSAEIGGDR
jgi:hypothetical protein